MTRHEPQFEVDLVATHDDLNAVQHLRYQVFVAEMGGQGAGVDHVDEREGDPFDAMCDHMVLRDRTLQDDQNIIGCYRLISKRHLAPHLQYYTEQEFNLKRMLGAYRNPLELGRSCLHPDYRGGAALMFLWKGLSEYIQRHQIDVLFGVASFSGNDIERHQEALSLLHARHLCKAETRPTSLQANAFIPTSPNALDRRRAMLSTPSLIKSYLRVGGQIGQGVFVDQAFNTVDVCMVVDVAAMPAIQKARLA